MGTEEPTIRAATPADARRLAVLIDQAGEGIPGWLWGRQAAAGQDALEIGAARAARDEGGFSYRNAWVAEVADGVAGMLLGYPPPDPYQGGSLDELPAVLRPLVELEALSPGSWYVNAVAVQPERRGGGIGSRLMALAMRQAVRSGCRQLSLVVAEDNRGAVALYRRLGYVATARRALVPWPGTDHGGDWVLMTRAAEAG
jgi:ribosomal protein S18 acetylase RimI-like enzyme